MQHLYSGGFALGAAPGYRLGSTPADVIESRANDHSTGCIVTVRKSQVWKPYGDRNHPARPTDLTIHVVWSDDTMSHGA
jgi:hypothetical protein